MTSLQPHPAGNRAFRASRLLGFRVEGLRVLDEEMG